MTVRQIEPLNDPRWPAFLQRHPHATVFHTPAWLDGLRRTYGYRPVVLTTAGPGEDLRDGLAFCRVQSRLTGSRIVSLPFSDHCEPLVEEAEDLGCLLAALKNELAPDKAKYFEIRPLTFPEAGAMDLQKAGSFCFHRLELRGDLEKIFGEFHKGCIQRKILRAEREGLRYEVGTSESLLTRFYRLQVLTRRRHHILPQPLSWFRNLLGCMGDNAKIHLASKDDVAVASILTLRYKDTLVYKYGCSDKRLSNLGGTPLLFWKAIQEAKAENLVRLDLGRSDWDNPGLIAFKDRLGAVRSPLTYWSYGSHPFRPSESRWLKRIAMRTLRYVPDPLTPLAGRLLYRHLP
jgi:hypothetical protein